MEYAKVKNGVLVLAPDTYISEVITITDFNKDIKLMEDFGYKPVSYDGFSGPEYTVKEEIEELTNRIVIHRILDNSEEVIEKYKEAKINQTLTNLEEYLYNHPLTSSVRGTELKYTVTQQKQNQLTSTISDYISNALPYLLDALTQGLIGSNLAEYMDNLNIDIYWNSQGDTCEKWKYSEIFQLKNEIVAYVRPIVEYQRYLEKHITSMTSQEDIIQYDISFTEEKLNSWKAPSSKNTDTETKDS